MIAPEPPSLIWIDLDAAASCLARAVHWLSREERARVSRFATPELRRRRLGARVFLRGALAQFMGRPPETIRIGTGAHGKPHVAGGPQFNLSHSGSVALLALHPGLPVGTDVEANGCDMTDVGLRVVLSAAETERGPRTVHDRLRLWVRKEAMAKAQGLGLLADMTGFTVGHEPFGGWRRIRGTGQVLHDGLLPGGYPMAVALTSTDCPSVPPRVTCFDAKLLDGFEAPAPRR